MSRHVRIKVYGHLWPADAALKEALAPVAAAAVPCPEYPVLELEGDLLRIAFEGIYFPLDEILQAVAIRLTPQCRGKLDYLDLEAWTLTRHTFRGTNVDSGGAPLNNVLEYSLRKDAPPPKSD